MASAILWVSSRFLTAVPRLEAASSSSPASFSVMVFSPRLRAAVTSQRRKLAAEAHALQAEIDDWRQAAAATNAVFAAAFEAWARGRQAADAGDAAATAALPAQEAGLEQRMAADVRGAGLLARRRELEARRGALDDEARQRVGERIRRQIERPAAPRKDAEKPEAAE